MTDYKFDFVKLLIVKYYGLRLDFQNTLVFNDNIHLLRHQPAFSCV